jgi:hypothetical protein
VDVGLSRDILRDILQEGHAQGWAIWKALITSVQLRGTEPRKAKKGYSRLVIEHARHVPLRPIPWREREAAAAIEDIVADGLEHFDAERFWPAHPLDEGIRDGHTSFYFGATGVIWSINYLVRVGATNARFDFRPVLPQLMEANQAELARLKRKDCAAHGSLLFGDLGTALLVMRVGPTPAIADLVYARADANTTLPVRELMWGTAGSMIACCHMAGMTAESRWRALFAIQAARLLRDLEETDDGPLWMQDLYGRHLRYLGPVHGYAGNMIALMRGWQWLTDDQRARIAEAVPRTLTANVWRSELGASWRGVVADRDKPPADRDNYSNASARLCQHCHGAPGMVTAFADAPFTSFAPSHVSYGFQTSIRGAGLLGLGAERVRSFAKSFPPGWRISLTTMRSGRPVAGMDRWPVLQEQPGVNVCECWHDLPFTKPGTVRLSVIDA